MLFIFLNTNITSYFKYLKIVIWEYFLIQILLLYIPGGQHTIYYLFNTIYYFYVLCNNFRQFSRKYKDNFVNPPTPTATTTTTPHTPREIFLDSPLIILLSYSNFKVKRGQFNFDNVFSILWRLHKLLYRYSIVLQIMAYMYVHLHMYITIFNNIN